MSMGTYVALMLTVVLAALCMMVCFPPIGWLTVPFALVIVFVLTIAGALRPGRHR